MLLEGQFLAARTKNHLMLMSDRTIRRRLWTGELLERINREINKELQTGWRTCRGAWACSSRGRRTCHKIIVVYNDRPGNMQLRRRRTYSYIMIIRETRRWWYRGKAKLCWDGGRHGWGNGGSSCVGREMRQSC